MDTLRFDEKHFGPLDTKPGTDGYPTIQCSSKTTNRALAICAAHSVSGCRIDAPKDLCGGPMQQRRAPAMNDVAFGNWRSNYGGFMRQTDLAATNGRWRVGSRTEMFGRFARGFSDPTNQSATISLQLDRGLWGGLPLGNDRNLTLRLIFWDVGRGSFAIGYDSQSGLSTLRTVAKSGSGRWRELCASVTDGHFGRRGPGGSDLWLVNVDREDDVFDSLELAEASAAELEVAGCDWG